MGSIGSGQTSYAVFTSMDYSNTISYGPNSDSVQHSWMLQNSNIDDWESSLTPDERSSILDYTGAKFRQMNDALYNVSFDDINPDLRYRIQYLSNAIDKFELRRGIEVTRESSPSLFGGNTTISGIKNFLARSNGILQINGFMSAEFSSDSLGLGLSSGLYPVDIVAHYKVPPSTGAGAYVDRISANGGENEWLFNRNGIYKYDINSIRYEGNKVHINARWIAQAAEQALQKKRKK